MSALATAPAEAQSFFARQRPCAAHSSPAHREMPRQLPLCRWHASNGHTSGLKSRWPSTTDLTTTSTTTFRGISRSRCGSRSSRSFWQSRRRSLGSSLRAMQADDVPPPSEMTYKSALDLLGVNEGASFDDILRAKKKQIEKSGGDQETIIRVEAAYDILLMQSLSRRRAGELVDNSVRFADVKRPRPSTSPSPPAWLANISKATSISFEKPASQELAVRAAVFGVLAAWTYASGLAPSTDSFDPYASSAASSDIPGLPSAIGFGASIYFLRKEGVGLGKAAALSTGALVVGALVGSAVESWLRVDIFPVLGISSPAVLVSEFGLVALGLAAAFVR